MSKVTANTNVVAETPVTATAEPVIRTTPVNERQYKIKGDKPALKSKQASIVLDILAASEGPMTIKQIAPIAGEKGLLAVGGIEPSVRYHLHHLTKAGITEVKNPTIVIA